jgi:CubicO group peptidase (beta-lactamase class C family)
MKQRTVKCLLKTVFSVVGLFGTTLVLEAQNKNVDSFIKNVMKERRIPGLQVAVVQKGKIAFLKSFGVANIQNAVPVTNQSIFAINSCTKAFTGVAMMQLVENGKINLDNPVSNYLDSLPQSWQQVKIRQLLTHISGLPDINRLPNPTNRELAGQTKDDYMWAKIKTAPMDFPTGEQFSYNQTNYVILGKIIDKFNGKPFTQVFNDGQFSLANMTSTVFADSRDVISNWAQTYAYVSRLDNVKLKEEKLVINYAEFTPQHRTASGLNSTAEDIANWIIALQKGTIFKNKTSLNTLWTAGNYNNGTPTQWALGWVTKQRPKHKAVMASGGGRSAFCVYPDDDLAVVILTNLAGASPEEFIDELAGFYNPQIPISDPITAIRMQLEKRGFENTFNVYKELQQKYPNFSASEVDLNDWAYRLLGKKVKEATQIFKLTTALYPDSWNAFDSYGEALLKDGQKQEAIIMYQKSVALNPDNKDGKKILERLLKE